ncbi:hypothetical protein D3C75_606490 [compost metagenome]
MVKLSLFASATAVMFTPRVAVFDQCEVGSLSRAKSKKFTRPPKIPLAVVSVVSEARKCRPPLTEPL